MDTQQTTTVEVGSAKEIAERCIRAIQAEGVEVVSAYLYGSHARNEAHRYSDVDVAVVSPDFSGNRFEDRRHLRDVCEQVSDRVELMPFHPDNFEDWHPLVHQIKTTGMKLV